MLRRFMLVVVLTFVSFVPLTIPAAARQVEPPDSMASLGNSITRGFNACGWFVDCPSLSWASGDDTQVNSHYLRIRRVNPQIEGNNFNDARSGAKVADLRRQAELAVDQEVDYVTILVGANDACTSSVSTMTPVDTFGAQLRDGLETLQQGLPDARVFMASIPDLKRLWSVAKDNPLARLVWDIGNICQSMLADPTSTDGADEARRNRVRQRVMDYNDEIASACKEYGPDCVYDGGAVFEYRFTIDHVSGWDYFHPNAAGQRVLAEITYEAGLPLLS